VRAMLLAALQNLRNDLTERERALEEAKARMPVWQEQMDTDVEVQKALALLERIQAICSDPVSRTALPKLLGDLGVRIGLTFGEGKFNGRNVRRLKGGIIAFGNRPLPCALRTGTGLPLPGGLSAPQNLPGCGCGRDHENEDTQGATNLPGQNISQPSRRRGCTKTSPGPQTPVRVSSLVSPARLGSSRRSREEPSLSKVNRGEPT